MFRRVTLVAAVALIGPGLTALPAAGAAPGQRGNPMTGYKNLVVIYEENHSFDNLYGGWGSVGGRRVDGVRPVPQVAQDGSVYSCLLQNDVNLTSPAPLPSTCTDAAHGIAASAFTNQPFVIDDYIPASSATCPNGVPIGTGAPGGCTRDLVHRFYQEQYQLDGGRQDRYVTGSDAIGLTMGRYDTTKLPVYQYLHSAGAPNYVVADRFFQAAFGGSFLNHQFLISARAPLVTDKTVNPAGPARNSVIDANGMPTSYKLYAATGPVVDGQLTQACPDGSTADWLRACGDLAVNTIQPASAPFGGGARMPLIDDAVYPNIGDRLTDAGVSWAWYSGGWDAATAGTPGPFFQYHHQPFNYFANYAPGTPGRAHLKDESVFLDAARAGTLPAVSFVKPYGLDNEHPGYASESAGSAHLVELLKAIMSGPQAKQTLVVVTYDEFGGQFDHVAPPTVDAFGPGTRIPALILSARMDASGVDHTSYDTTSILATIEHAYRLAPLSSRDASVADLRNAIRLGSD